MITKPVITKLPSLATSVQKGISGPVPGTASGRPTQRARFPHQAEPASMDQSDKSPKLSPPLSKEMSLSEIHLFWSIRHACQSIPGRNLLLQEKKHVLQKKTHFFPLMLACPLCANGFFLPKVLFSSAISVFPHEKWWSVVSCWAEVMRSLSSQVPAVISRWTGPWREVDLSRMLTLTPVLSLHLQCPQYQRYRNKKWHSGHAKVNET